MVMGTRTIRSTDPMGAKSPGHSGRHIEKPRLTAPATERTIDWRKRVDTRVAAAGSADLDSLSWQRPRAWRQRLGCSSARHDG